MPSVLELSSFSTRLGEQVYAEVKRIEKASFPRAEVFDFDKEHIKLNTSILVSMIPADGAQGAQVVGYLVYQRNIGRVAAVPKICVAEDFRRLGYGRQMLQDLETRMKKAGCASLMLWVDTDREAALGLYQSCGFKIAQTVEDYYSPGRDAHKMVLQLV